MNLQNSARVHELLRAGNLYLSLQDALALAIENNLDIELERYLLPQADAELLRSHGGGTLRGLNFTLAEVPSGVGGPLSPVETGAAVAGQAATGVSVATSATELGVLGAPQDNLSVQGAVAQSTGSAVSVPRSRRNRLAELHPPEHPGNRRAVLRHQCPGDQHHHRQHRYFHGLLHRCGGLPQFQ